MTSASSVAPEPRSRPGSVNMARHAHLSGVFAPQRDEVDVADLPVSGVLPPDLAGSYIRNGPNPRFDPIGSYVYPLDGDAMVHRVVLDGVSARYTNRFVRTPMVVAEERAGQALWGGVFDGFTPDESVVGPELAGTTRDLPDINIVSHGGRLLAMAEGSVPYALDSTDLGTLGTCTCDGAMLTGSTAHPKIDPATGEMVLFHYTLEAPYLTWSVVAADGTLSRPPTPVAGANRALMIHDMALTPHYVVLLLCPLTFEMGLLAAGGSPLSWEPDLGIRVALIPRDGSAVRWFDCEPFWVWHIANAYESAPGLVHVDYAHWSSPTGMVPSDRVPRRSLSRMCVDLDARTVDTSIISERPFEFPRVDDRSVGSRHHVIAAVEIASAGTTERPGVDTLWFVDPDSGTETALDAGPITVGEPIFMPGGERDYWGTIGTDKTTMASWFLIVAADDPAAGPVASVKLPLRVPAGLHGSWIPE